MARTRLHFILLLGLLVRPALAEERPFCPQPLHFGVFEFNIFYSKGKGIDVDLVQELEQRSGCSIVIVDEPRAREWVELESGALEMTGAALVTPERNRFAWFAPYAVLKNYAITRSPSTALDTPAEILAADDLVVGVVRSYRHGAAIDAMLDQLRRTHPERIREVDDQDALFDVLAADPKFLIFGQPNAYGAYFRAKGITDARIIDIVPAEQPTPAGIAFSRARFSAEEAAKWLALVKGIRRDGTLAGIVGRYVEPGEARKMLAF
jgi:polar amino acid transport system substrate-binding protein